MKELLTIGQALGREEMKKLMAGSGGGSCKACASSCPSSCPTGKAHCTCNGV